MSARAHRRDVIRRQHAERVEEERRIAAEAGQITQQVADEREAFEAGPPDACPAWSWGELWVMRHFGATAHGWNHGASAQPGPKPPRCDTAPPGATLEMADDHANWCWHPAHGDEALYCGPIILG